MKLTEKLSLIHELESSMNLGDQSEHNFLEDLTDVAKRTTNSDRATLFLYHPETNILVSEIAQGLTSKIYIEMGQGLVGNSAQSKEVLIECDVDTTKHFNADIDLGSGYVTYNALTMPLLGEDKDLLGVIQVLNKKDANYDQTDEDLLASISKLFAKCLDR